jgi:hypothetical protein
LILCYGPGPFFLFAGSSTLDGGFCSRLQLDMAGVLIYDHKISQPPAAPPPGMRGADLPHACPLYNNFFETGVENWPTINPH